MQMASSRAQGTIEYLIIIAIVVVIALVVVGLLTSFLGSGQGISSASSEIGANLGVSGISLPDMAAGADSNALIIIKNLASGTVIVDSIEVDGEVHDYDQAIPLGEQESFRAVGVPACDGINGSYSIIVRFSTESGLQRSADFGEIIVDCTSSVHSSGGFVEETGDMSAPAVTSFDIPPTSAALTVTVSSFVATDNVAVAGYLITESASAPSAGDAGWSSAPQAAFVFSSEGSKTLYAWAKDAADNVSASASDTVVVDLIDHSYDVSGVSTPGVNGKYTYAGTMSSHHYYENPGGFQIFWGGGWYVGDPSYSVYGAVSSSDYPNTGPWSVFVGDGTPVVSTANFAIRVTGDAQAAGLYLPQSNGTWAKAGGGSIYTGGLGHIYLTDSLGDGWFELPQTGGTFLYEGVTLTHYAGAKTCVLNAE